jgi:hypothetical protein
LIRWFASLALRELECFLCFSALKALCVRACICRADPPLLFISYVLD